MLSMCNYEKFSVWKNIIFVVLLYVIILNVFSNRLLIVKIMYCNFLSKGCFALKEIAQQYWKMDFNF